ncbi:MAG: DUF262 domain-containing protein [Planctomycetia bacterium]|nr:DUF262 domain-containing protein [Planctomycetia bacterium]
MKTNDTPLTKLMEDVASGTAQLPDFQRGWVWDDGRIKALILSVIRNFPVGAAMFLEYGNENVQFKYKAIEGATPSSDAIPEKLILDGQQRLTSLYNALYSKSPVKTQTDRGKDIERFYYLNIEKALDPTADDDEIIVSIPATRQVTSEFGRKIELDLSTREDEFKHKMFPLNIILNSNEEQEWQNQYYAYYNYAPEVIKQFTDLFSKFIVPTQKYAMPVILLEKETPREAVCQVFENVNTGGVSLTVFELVTAVFAMDNFGLRKDWESRREKYFSGALLNVVTPTDFLTALTLLSTYNAGGVVSSKKKDVLALKLDSYKTYADELCNGFSEAENLLQEERIFSSRDLPYTAQLVPLACICTVLKKEIGTATVRNKVKQWYWCGVFGEQYGSFSSSQFADDIIQVVKWITVNGELPKTIRNFFFNPTRLLGLKSRLSAAYKGIMALILQNHARDFISGSEMDISSFADEKIDIHHIFPWQYCVKQNYNNDVCNSVVNKTPISAKSNRAIGGVAPSVYLGRLEKKGSVEPAVLDGFVETHWIDPVLLRNNDFHAFIIDRAKKLLNAIEQATGRTIAVKDSDEVRKEFGDSLI